MFHYPASDDKGRDLIYDDDYRSYLMARSNSPDGYRFGRMRGKRSGVRARGYLKSLIEAIANAKLRRMRRELELHGIRLTERSR
jgi:hypothetical protein